MKYHYYDVDDIEETGELMRQLVLDHCDDVEHLSHLSIKECFDLTASIPYKEDPDEYEHLQRPGVTLSGNALNCDCDDKSILLGSFLHLRDIEFWFLAVQDDPGEDGIHHVLIELVNPIDGVKYLDATYPQNNWGEYKPFIQKVRI